MSLIWKHCLFLNSFLRCQKTDVAASSDRSLNALPEGEEPAEWMYRPGQAPIATSPVCLQCEICPEAVGVSRFVRILTNRSKSSIANNNGYLDKWWFLESQEAS